MSTQLASTPPARLRPDDVIVLRTMPTSRTFQVAALACLFYLAIAAEGSRLSTVKHRQLMQSGQYVTPANYCALFVDGTTDTLTCDPDGPTPVANCCTVSPLATPPAAAEAHLCHP